MKSLYPRCGALDVHKETVVACARVQKGTRVSRDVATFAATTAGLLALADWLAARRCSPVAMEATGVYWKPVWHVLEGRCELVLANAAAVRNVPGRKGDVTDAVWLADLLAHGLIRASFVPPAPIQALRDLTRTRKQLVRQVAQHTLRLQKTLEDANLKITGIVTDLLGPSGRAILRALIAGETDPERLLPHTTGRLRAPRARLLAGLHGAVTAHHRFLLHLHLEQIEALERAIAQLEVRVAELIAPFHESVARLTTIPGVSHLVAHVLVAEVGLDMTRFPSPAHLRSWAGLCPRLDESAGKRRSTRLRLGAPWLKTTLVQAAWAAVKVKHSYFRAQFLRLRARRGPKRAIVAVAASLLTAAYCMLRDATPYRALGATYFDQRDRSHILRRLTRRIEARRQWIIELTASLGLPRAGASRPCSRPARRRKILAFEATRVVSTPGDGDGPLHLGNVGQRGRPHRREHLEAAPRARENDIEFAARRRDRCTRESAPRWARSPSLTISSATR